ncbi:MAG: HEAT repeat domain-containing protein [Deltaproteobacteria bacterium]|nr:HEAT repeat domain-containing protein [Deltaproteobacteria bacterium]
MSGLREFVQGAGALGLTWALLTSPSWAEGTGEKGTAGASKGAARALDPSGTAIDVKAVRAELFGVDSDAAAAAAEKLGKSRQPGALDALLDALSLGLHPRVAARAIEAVGEHGSPSALDVLIHYSKHRSADVRAKAVFALGKLQDPRAVSATRGAFSDADSRVRAAAAQVAKARKDLPMANTMIALLKKGDEAMAQALAVIATPDLSRRVAELIGEVPDSILAECLGAMLLRPDLGKEDIYVEIVRALGKIPGEAPVVALTAFLGAVPEKSSRQSRREAQAIYEQRLGGGN